MSTRRLIILCLCLLLFARLALGARELSFTSDEPSHIATGYAYIARGAVWTVPLRGHPPLYNAWLALPVYLGLPQVPLEQLDGWEVDNTRFVKSFVPHLREHVVRHETAARVPAMLVAVLLSAVVVRWAEAFGGSSGSVLALLALSADPTFLAHGMLATNDVGVVALGTLGLYTAIRLPARPNAKRVILSGFALGLAVLAKGSGIIWLAAALLSIALSMWRRTQSIAGLRRGVALSAAVTVTALLCVWACYGFEWGPLSVGPVTTPSVPAPTHWQGILAQSGGAAARYTYFLGRVREGGHWAYFPVSTLIKNPLPWLVLGSWAILSQAHRLVQRRGAGGFPWAFPILYLGTAIGSGVNIGYRHLLAIHPFVYLLIAALPWRARLTKAIGGALIALLVAESFIVAPYFLSYFSPIVGGSSQGWRYLADSNTDWGQGYKALRDYQLGRADDQPLRYSGPEGYIGLRTYEIAYEPLPPNANTPVPILKPYLYPDAGLYVISANSLSGLGSVAPDNYAWFRYHESDRIIADALFVYEVPPLPEKSWFAQCSIPGIALGPDAIAEAFPHPPARLVTFDCTQTWIYPGGEAGPGWYALHEQLLAPGGGAIERLDLRSPGAEVPFLERRVNQLAVSYRQWDYRETPAFVVYDGQPVADLALPGTPSVAVGPAETPPTALQQNASLPVSFDGPLALVEMRAYHGDQILVIETWWRVVQEANSAPFSVMAHLTTADGTPVEVADGFGLRPTDLRAGDVVVQAHHFTLPENPEDLWLRAGVYWLDTTQRWRIADRNADAVYVPVTNITVR